MSDDPSARVNLSDCVSNDYTAAELFVVQEEFAATAKQGRDRLTQAVLPITSAILEIDRAEIAEVLDDGQARKIISSLGVGINLGPGPSSIAFDIQKLRYGKIIIVSDATSQGNHIRAQVASFFHRFNYPILAAGHVYLSACDGLGDENFGAKVMEPLTRILVPLPACETLAKMMVVVDGTTSLEAPPPAAS